MTRFHLKISLKLDLDKMRIENFIWKQTSLKEITVTFTCEIGVL